MTPPARGANDGKFVGRHPFTCRNRSGTMFKVTSLHKLIVFADTVEDGLKGLEAGPATS